MDSGGANRFRAGGAQIRPEGRRHFAAAPLLPYHCKKCRYSVCLYQKETNAAKKGAAERYADQRNRSDRIR